MPLPGWEPRSSKAEDTLLSMTPAVAGEFLVHTVDPNLAKASGTVRSRAPHKDQTRHNYGTEGANHMLRVYFPVKLVHMEPASPSNLSSFVHPQPPAKNTGQQRNPVCKGELSSVPEETP